MAYLRRTHHELLVREFIRNGGNGAEAYRSVATKFPGKPLKNPDSPAVCACRILSYPEVQARYKELQNQMAKRADITEDKILSDYQWAIESAKAQDKPNEVTMAATAQAKLVGLLRERVEAGNVGDFDNMENISDVLEAVKDLVGPEAALALAQAFKVAEKRADDGMALIDAETPTDAVN